MALELRSKFGSIDLGLLGGQLDEIAKLDDSQQLALSSLVSAVETRTAAAERVTKAQRAVTEADAEQRAALEAHQIANPPPTQREAHLAAIAAYRPQ